MAPQLKNKIDQLRTTEAYQAEYLKEVFSDELWQAMQKRDLTQVDFAAKAKVSKQFLTRIFRGANCTIETMNKLAHALQFKVQIHLTPNELDCDWLHFIKVQPLENHFNAEVYSDEKYITDKPEVKYEIASSGH